MKEFLYDIPVREKFEHDGKIFFILHKEGNMAEVVEDHDPKRRKWAWPLTALVNPLPSER